MTNKKSNRRTIYDQNHYKAQAMLLDPWFIAKINWLKSRFVEIGHPLPKRSFKKYKDYMAWNDGFWKRHTEMMKSAEYLEEKNKITGGKERISGEEYDKLKEFEEQFLPPIYGQVYNEILEHYGIKRDHKGFRDFLEYHIFYGHDEYLTAPFSLTWKRNSKTRKLELFIRLSGHTKKEDIIKHWDWIAQEQKSLPDYVGKNKEWNSFERDMEIYSQYKALKDPAIKRRNHGNSLDAKLWADLSKRWPELTMSNIRSIVAKTRKRLGEI